MATLPHDPVSRTLAGILAGLVLGTLVLETILAGLDFLFPGYNPESLFTDSGGPAWYPGWCMATLAAGVAGGAMASGVARRWPAGLLAGMLLAAGTGLHAALTPLPASLVLILALIPLIGAAAGTRLATMVIRRDRLDVEPRQANGPGPESGAAGL